MNVNGLPLHPLIVHGAVVLVPLTLIFAALLFIRRIRTPMTLMAGVSGIVAFIFVAVAHNSGEQLQEALAPSQAITKHAELAGAIMPLAFATGAVLAVLALLELRRPAALVRFSSRLSTYRWVLPVLRVCGVLLAVASVVQIVLLGDSGAAAVWSTRVPATP